MFNSKYSRWLFVTCTQVYVIMLHKTMGPGFLDSPHGLSDSDNAKNAVYAKWPSTTSD